MRRLLLINMQEKSVRVGTEVLEETAASLFSCCSAEILTLVFSAFLNTLCKLWKMKRKIPWATKNIALRWEQSKINCFRSIESVYPLHFFSVIVDDSARRSTVPLVGIYLK